MYNKHGAFGLFYRAFAHIIIIIQFDRQPCMASKQDDLIVLHISPKKCATRISDTRTRYTIHYSYTRAQMPFVHCRNCAIVICTHLHCHLMRSVWPGGMRHDSTDSHRTQTLLRQYTCVIHKPSVRVLVFRSLDCI